MTVTRESVSANFGEVNVALNRLWSATNPPLASGIWPMYKCVLEQMKVPFPRNFDKDRHLGSVVATVRAKVGAEWTLSSLDEDAKVMVFRRHVAETTVTAAAKTGNDAKAPESFQVSLSVADAKPTMGEKVAATLQDTYPGFYLTDFDPHLARATLTKLDDDTARCRGAVATALGVKPWDVQAAPRPGGGYLLGLPKSYMPSKHDEKLDEVATSVVGRFGWYVAADANKLTAQIIPSDPPTFPEMLSADLARLGTNNMCTPFGLKLPKPGEDAHEVAEIDWKAQAFALVSGLPGSGKTVTLNQIIADHLAAGGLLNVVDERQKSLDFAWAKSFVVAGGWGCNGLREAVTTLSMMYAEGERRAAWMAERGYVNWLDIPEGERFKPMLAIVDEVSALLVTEKLPAGVDKSLPEVQEIIEENRLKFKLQRRIAKIIAEQRFVGMRMVLSTQISNANTGLPPSMKGLIGHKLLQGTNPSKTQRTQAFNVESTVPVVPENLRGGGVVSKGVGAAELEAQAPFVYKSYFASTQALADELRRRGVPATSRPEPTQAEMDEYCPVSEEDLDDEGPAFDPRRGGTETFSDDGEQLFGAAAAAAASKRLEAQAKAQRAAKEAAESANGELSNSTGPQCPSCHEPIQIDGSCGC